MTFQNSIETQTNKKKLNVLIQSQITVHYTIEATGIVSHLNQLSASQFLYGDELREFYYVTWPT